MQTVKQSLLRLKKMSFIIALALVYHSIAFGQNTKTPAKFDASRISFYSSVGLGIGIPSGTYLNLIKSNLSLMKSSAAANYTIDGGITPKIGVLIDADATYSLSPKGDIHIGLLFAQYGFSYKISSRYRNPDIQEDTEEKWAYQVNINNLAFKVGGSYYLSPKVKVDGSILFGSTINSTFKSSHTYQHFCNKEVDESSQVDEKQKGAFYGTKAPIGLSLGLEFTPKKIWGYRIGMTNSGNLGSGNERFRNLLFSFSVTRHFSFSPSPKSNL